jgi:glycosyltransferase involved in cell wall biosynthesis
MNVKLSIGMPVYNGELFIERAIESILAQTFTDFELIISDNASTDSTHEICQSFSKKDNRIRIFKQEKNIGVHRNFYFLLSQARGEYFVWAAVDDYLDKDFMEKNLKVLESNNSIVSSIGKIIPYGTESLNIDPKLIDTSNYPKFLKNYVKRGRHKKMMDAGPISGDINTKIRNLLKITKALGRWYGVHRTEQLKQCIIKKPFINVEVAVFLNLLRLGDFSEESSTTQYEFDEGVSSRGIINMAKNSGHNLFEIIFPFYPFTKWLIQNFGILTFMRNFDILFRMNCGGGFALSVDLFLKIINAFKKTN